MNLRLPQNTENFLIISLPAAQSGLYSVALVRNWIFTYYLHGFNAAYDYVAFFKIMLRPPSTTPSSCFASPSGALPYIPLYFTSHSIERNVGGKHLVTLAKHKHCVVVVVVVVVDVA
jgi:hypothetical protein